MKIIDNKKDYYDYLAGIYGIDDKVVYDRRCSITYNEVKKKYPSLFDNNEIEIRIGFKYFNIHKGVSKWIDNPHKDAKHNYKLLMDYNPDEWGCDESRYKDKEHVLFDYEYRLKHQYHVKDDPELDDGSIEDIIPPIEIISSIQIPNPILSTFPMVSKFIKPEVIWDEVYNFITTMKEKDFKDTRTDKEHIISAGFDTKTSFRKM